MNIARLRFVCSLLLIELFFWSQSTPQVAWRPTNGPEKYTSVNTFDARDSIDIIKLWSKQTDRFKISDVPFDSITRVFGFGSNSWCEISIQIERNNFLLMSLSATDELNSTARWQRTRIERTRTFDGSGLASGIYFYHLTAASPAGRQGTFSQTKKLVLFR